LIVQPMSSCILGITLLSVHDMAAEPLHSPVAHRGFLTAADSFSVSYEAWTILGILLATILAHRIWNQHNFRLPPIINPRNPLDLTGAAVKKDFVLRSNELLDEGSKAFGERPYTIMSDTGPIIILSPKHVDEIRNDPRLDFLKNTEHVSQTVYLSRYEVEKILTGII
jgi:hypothetical protein